MDWVLAVVKLLELVIEGLLGLYERVVGGNEDRESSEEDDSGDEPRSGRFDGLF